MDQMKKKDERINYLWRLLRTSVTAFTATVKMQKLLGK
jgi:hypothetical protein